MGGGEGEGGRKINNGGGSGEDVRGGVVVSLAGSSGAGKACLAAEVVGRKDVRAKFSNEVLWLQVKFWMGLSGRGFGTRIGVFVLFVVTVGVVTFLSLV